MSDSDPVNRLGAAGTLQSFTIADTPLLSQGSSMALVARAAALWMHVKVYKEGGENGLHCHPVEDHIFYVVKGHAIFTDDEGNTFDVGPNGGMAVPRGALYSFVASGEDNLVMLRIGTATEERYARDAFPGAPAAVVIRHHADGTGFKGTDVDNKTGALKGVPSGALLGSAV